MSTSNITVSDVKSGDIIISSDGTVDYKVHMIELNQGQVQIVDTEGNVHIYHETEILAVRQS